jgi:ABC-type multidrug transport system fused ATPase/permease subunit
MWTVIHALPVILGLLVGQVFDTLSGEAGVGESPWTAVVLFAAIAVGRNGILWLGDVNWIRYWNEQTLQLRRNLLRWLLEAPGSRELASSPGEAVSTFRDDVDDLVEYVENYVDAGGLVLFAAGAVAVMAGIDGGLTLLVLLPLVLTGVLTQALSPQIRRRRRTMRLATEQVTGFIGEVFGGVQSIKLADAAGPVLDHFERLNETRRKAALADTFLTELLRSINTNMATIGSAIVLMIAAGAIRDGSFTVGDLAIFLTYLPRLTGYMAFAGDIIAQHRRTGVAYERIRALAVDAPDSALLDRSPVPLAGGVAPPPVPPSPEPFRMLEVEHLAYRFPDDGSGLSDVSFQVRRGEFVVITGKIGSGKTTLLRALLGLVPAAGERRWNGRPVPDPAAFFVPPRTAYTSQIPRLFSDTLAQNIALGRHLTRERLREAVDLAVLDPDLERLEQGLHTLVGARGVKLSGGQVQRSAAARMFATQAELLVFDDLSSALDVDTERLLWERLFARREATCLVVSHRHPVLERADVILVMDGGRVVDRGKLDELLERSPIMRSLWEGEDAG